MNSTEQIIRYKLSTIIDHIQNTKGLNHPQGKESLIDKTIDAIRPLLSIQKTERQRVVYWKHQIKEAQDLASKQLEKYACKCMCRDEHGCIDCMNSGLILDNEEIGVIYQIYQALSTVGEMTPEEITKELKRNAPKYFEGE